MKDYKDTLLMGKTEFEMRGNLGQKEPLIQQKWNENKIYERVLEKNKGKEEYTLHDGPPYANGDIHLGHALNKILKDIIVRYKNMNGYYSLYIPGWDTHGLPIENALQKSGINRKEMPLSEFRDLCTEYAYKQVVRQRVGFERLGVMADFDSPYITLQKEFERDQVRVFGKMVERGLIYKGLKPVYWSPSSESALAEAEIEYKDITSKSIYFKFPIIEQEGNLKDASFLVWTTTPWTLPGNVAVCAGPEIDYVLFNSNKGKLICASELLKSLRDTLSLEDVEVIEKFKGNELLNIKYQSPLYEDRTGISINADYVTTTDGTGFVHIAPGYGEEDYEAAKKYGLPMLVYVDDRGIQMPQTGKYAGMFYEKSEDLIIEDLKEKGYLLKLNPIVHSYPHDWRTKKPVIFRATPQWFASIDPIKDDILAAIHEVKWNPTWGDTRISNMIKDRHDWCISRQRAWGVPIPVFYCEDGEAILDPAVIEHVSQIFGEFGSNEWFKREAKDLLPEGYTNPHSPNGIFKKEMDIMDVWFDSGSSHKLLERRGLKYPADLYLEGSDQYRGWFNSSIITGVATTGKSPYKAVLSHGFTLDGEGRKMSKSLGNTVDPIKVCNENGADILRLWVASVDFKSDFVMSKELIKQVSDSYRKIRNTIKFMLANLEGYTKEDEISFEDMPNVDKYMMIKLNNFVASLKDSYDSFDFNAVYKTINTFIANNLSAFYLDFVKDILYIEPASSLARRSVQTVLYNACKTLICMLSPIIPHTASEAYSYLPGEKELDVYLEDLPQVKDYSSFKNIEENFDNFMIYRDEILKALEEARANKIIGKSFAAKLTLTLDEKASKLFKSLDANIAQILIVSQYEEKEGSEFKVEVKPAEGSVCSRCWATVENVLDDELCPRCHDIVVKFYANPRM